MIVLYESSQPPLKPQDGKKAFYDNNTSDRVISVPSKTSGQEDRS